MSSVVAEPARPVIDAGLGIIVYPARFDGDRWRAVWYEEGERQGCESIREDRLAEKLEKVKVRLASGAENMTKPGADLIAHYLDPDRLPVEDRWSRRHAYTQMQLCDRFAGPVIGDVTCENIAVHHVQEIVNAAPTSGEGNRVRQMISALVNVGVDAGYLVNPRLAKVHWQPAGRPVPGLKATVAGESPLWVDPAEIPSADDVGGLGRALAAGLGGDGDELMANTAAYSGLRWGEIAALGADQVLAEERVIAVERKVVEVAGHLFVEVPKNRKLRQTIYPRLTPGGYPLASRLATRAEEACAEREAGTNPLRLMFPSPQGRYLRSSNFNRRSLKPAFRAAGWRDGSGPGTGKWTWHSLRHVFCTAALFTWKLDATDVSRLAGHSNYRVTLDMYVGTTAGVLDRARAATE